MPALKTTLRFLALGACADVATAFGTIGRVGEVVKTVTESVAPSCPCDNYWYCQLSGAGSLNQPSSASMNSNVLAKSVARCWNYCFKDPAQLKADEWTLDATTGTCPACERFEKGAWGCECKTEAPYYSDCNERDGDGRSKADIWYMEICSPNYKPGGTLFDQLDETYQGILPYDTVTLEADPPDRNESYTEAVAYNPFKHYEKSPDSFQGSPCVQRGTVSVDADAPASVACAGVVKDGSKDVGGKAGCAAEGAVADCTSLYYYGDSWVYYCKPGSEWPKDDFAAFDNFCRSRADDECGTVDDVKYYVENPYGKYNTCYLKSSNKCRIKWPGVSEKPTVTESFCVAPAAAGGDDDGTSAFATEPSVCKQMLCGDGGVVGADPNNPSCDLY